jgi:hypothetical protein
LYDDPVDDDEGPEDDDADYNALVDEFGAENVDLADYYLHRYKLFKLRRTLIELDWDDLIVFLLLEEEVGNAQAVQQLKMEQQTRNTQHGYQ